MFGRLALSVLLCRSLSICCLCVCSVQCIRNTLFIPFVVCDYCSTGDLYTYWIMIGQFGEDAVKVFAAELGSALGESLDLVSSILNSSNLNKLCVQKYLHR